MQFLNDAIAAMQAPEILEMSPATMASDVYSFALVMWEVLVWQLPWTGKPMYTVSPACIYLEVDHGSLGAIKVVWLCADPPTGHKWKPPRDPITLKSAWT